MTNKKKYAIGIDIGGTNMPCSLVDEFGNIIKTIEKRTMPEQGPDAVVDKIVESVEQIIQFFKKNINNGTILGVGLGTPGVLDLKNGKIITGPNLDSWKNVPIVKLIEEKIHLPIRMDNDANCAAIGEHWVGAAKGAQNAILMTLGSGLGGGIIIDNSIYRGSHGTAGEIGHISIVPDGERCACGNLGCLEAYSSANATVIRALKQLKKKETNSTLKENNISKITAHDIFLNAEAGDLFSKNILEESGRYLGIGIATIASIFDPDIIIIGGGFSSAHKYLFPSAIEEAYKRSFKHVMDNIKIVRAKLGNDAGIVGAAKLLF
ncbi:MAG: ROK family protein [bacterium]